MADLQHNNQHKHICKEPFRKIYMETGSLQSSLKTSPFTLLQPPSENNEAKETIPVSPLPGRICILIFFFPIFLPLSSLLCVPFPGVCCCRAQLNLANSHLWIEKSALTPREKKVLDLFPSPGHLWSPEYPESSQKAQG